METTLTIKTNKELRNKAKKTANELGIPLGTVINAMLKQFVREKEILLSARNPNKMTMRAIGEALAGKKLETFDSFKQWKKEMRSV
jgi:addiction module RelB/DinJ family antitoxin